MLIDQLFPNDVITESAYGAAAGVETIRQLIHAVKDSKDIDLKVGPEMFPVRYDEARYLLSLWKANRDGGDKTADLFGNVNWIQDKLEDRDYRMGPGKLKDIDIERAKEIQKDRVLNLESDCECGADKEKETEFHKKLDDLVHSTFGKRKDENVEEGLEDSDRPPATQDYITKTIAKKIKPGLDPDGEEFEDEAYLYHTSQLGRQNLLAKGGNWRHYYDAIKWWYKNMNESVNEDYKGWAYDADIIDYDDNRKISHYATKDGKEVSMDWSPYSTPSEEDFALWVDLGMPDRKAVNGIGPLNIDDLIQLAKDKPEVTHSLLVKEDDKEVVDQEKLDAKTKIALKKAGLKYGAQTKGDPLAALTTFVADKDSEKNQEIDRLDQENDEEDKLIAQQDVVDKEHSKKLGNNDLQDKYQDQEIERLKQALEKLLSR